ncbi:AAA family ATPase [Halopiger aswanensis]|uniref:Kinase n=1 Tax=Halopiger aswanensis TaxID=148449 RepID=A0A3R7DYL1_9EURY|nr:AAA family ATPase [Halopiger aswanensis]RKD94013.1 hypothetical protein ATJ93_3648 [Halopiger aswanensis]
MSRPSLIVYCGLPGVGKSAAAAYTADELPARRFRSDEIRKELFPEPEYTAAETAATYDELLERGREALASGSNVVLDATFRSTEYRDRAAALAAEVDAADGVAFVRVTCETDVVTERLDQRTTAESVSDAGLREYRLVSESFEPLERDHVVVDNSGPLEETYRQIDRSVLDR